MAIEGWDVSVFCGGKNDGFEKDDNGVSLFKVSALNKEQFRENVLAIFSKIHYIKNFDIIESPDYGADGYFIKIAFPFLPYVVKLHSPSYLIANYSNFYLQYVYKNSITNHLKNTIKKILRIKNFKQYEKQNDIEYKNASLANLITSPSSALLSKVKADWGLVKSKTFVIRNLYVPSQNLLSIPLTYNHNRITLIGKISMLKGLLDFVEVIPTVLKKILNVKFRFIGIDTDSPEVNLTMSEFIKEKCEKYIDNIEFTGKINLNDVPKYLAQTDMVICNSLWENYPTVILESMSAGRIVVGTRVGGIPEIITDKQTGFLVDSKKPNELAKCIIQFYENISMYSKFGNEARNYIVNNNSKQEILFKIKESYCKTIIECTQ